MMDGDNSEKLMLVGIGASAGGVEPLRLFFEQMPADTGMAFVVILHLARERPSRLAEVLQAKTSMPVTQVTEAVRVEANHVYVIPPDSDLYMADGQIRLAEREPKGTRPAPVDLFFRTLADSYRERAIAVVLSGAGADGSLGLGRVKEQGGVSFAQEPSEAEHPAMPRAAAETGMVDFVMPVAAMPEKLVSLHRNANRIQLPPTVEPSVSEDEGALRELLGLLRARTRHDFSDYKRTTLLRRVERRMQVTQTADIPAYLEHVREHPEELQGLLGDLLITVTNFFRDPGAFTRLEAEIAPRLFEGKGPNDQVRVWTTGCATGEEAYSLAMLLVEQAERLAAPPSIQVFASDIDEHALQYARAGVYPDSIAADLSPERLGRFFVREGQYYRVRRELRESVLFSPHNVLRDPPFSKLDLVSCRNLLIYINRQTQERVLEIFHFALRPGGHLFLGSAETAEGMPELFTPVDKKQRLFRRRDVEPNFRGVPALPVPGRWVARAARPEAPPAGAAHEPSGYGEMHYQALEAIAPPSVLVDPDYEIVHVSEHAWRYLRVAGGEPSRNLLRMAHPDLRLELRSLLLEAAAQSGRASRDVPVGLEAGRRVVRVSAQPLTSPRSAPGFHVVVFEELQETPPLPASAAKVAADGSHPAGGEGRLEAVARRLEEELERTKGELRATVEQYETQAEEFKAANEELQAMNEELRSATEELETSKEELQSVNEELTTLNAELKERVDEVSHSNSDLQNLMDATQIGTLFLDRSLRVMRYTPGARELFNLIPGDLGRPVAHITHGLDYGGLVEDAAEVLKTLHTSEREVGAKDGRHYLMRLTPYRTLDDRIGGVVVAFVDITERRRAEEAVRASEKRLHLALDAADMGTFLYRFAEDRGEPDARMLRLFGLPKGGALNLAAALAGIIHTDDRERYAAAIARAADPTGDGLLNEEIRVIHPDKSLHWVAVTGQTIFAGEQPGASLMYGVAADITERKQSEQELTRTNELLQATFDGSLEDIQLFKAVRDETGAIVDFVWLLTNKKWNDRWGNMSGKSLLKENPGVVEAGLFDKFVNVTELGVPVLHEQYYAHEQFNGWFQQSIVKVEDGFLTATLDITERKRAEEALRESEERLQTAQEAGNVGVWDWDAARGKTYWSETMWKIYGVAPQPGELVQGIWASSIHPEDRGRVKERVARLLDSGETEYRDEFCIVRPDGSVRWVEAVARITRGKTGEPLRMSGVNLDITDRKQAEESLRASEERLRLVVESVEDYAILTTDAGGRIQSWNPGAERTFGYTEEEAVGQNVEIIFTPEDRAAGAHEEEMRQARETGRAADERWHVSKLGARFYVSGVLAPLLDGEGRLTGYAKIARDLTERKQLEDARGRAHDELEERVRERTAELQELTGTLLKEVKERAAAEERVRGLLRQLVTVQEEERRRISRELHDTLGQQLTGLRLSIDIIRAESEGGAQMQEHIERTRGIFDQLDSDVNFLAWELRPAALDHLGLDAALRSFVGEWSEHFGVEAEYSSVGGEALRLPADVETNLYRILQEALQNVHKHAGADRVSVILERRGGQTQLIIEDNGRGYDPEAEEAAGGAKGMGVTNMRERAALVGGSLEIESAAGQGVTIFVRVPDAGGEKGGDFDERG